MTVRMAVIQPQGADRSRSPGSSLTHSWAGTHAPKRIPSADVGRSDPTQTIWVNPSHRTVLSTMSSTPASTVTSNFLQAISQPNIFSILNLRHCKSYVGWAIERSFFYGLEEGTLETNGHTVGEDRAPAAATQSISKGWQTVH